MIMARGVNRHVDGFMRRQEEYLQYSCDMPADTAGADVYQISLQVHSEETQNKKFQPRVDLGFHETSYILYSLAGDPSHPHVMAVQGLLQLLCARLPSPSQLYNSHKPCFPVQLLKL